MRRRGSALIAVLAVALLTGCGERADRASADGQAFVAGDGSIEVLSESDRDPAPDLTGETLAGDTFSLADQRGDVVVINVWASWCGPCRSEAPALREVSRQTAGDDVRFVGLVTRDSPVTAAAFAAKNRLAYPHVRDDDGSLQLLFRDTLPPAAIPSTIVIDREGRVAARVLGEVSAASLRAIIDPLLAAPGGSAPSTAGASS